MGETHIHQELVQSLPLPHIIHTTQSHRDYNYIPTISKTTLNGMEMRLLKRMRFSLQQVSFPIQSKLATCSRDTKLGSTYTHLLADGLPVAEQL